MNIVMYKHEQHGVDTYVCPLCALLDIAAEGVLCASMDQLYEYEGELEW